MRPAVSILCLALLLAAWHETQGKVAEQRIYDSSQFPPTRPDIDRLIKEFGWRPFRDISTAKFVNAKGWEWAYRRNQQNAINITFMHAPLARVNAAGMAYWWDIIHRNTTLQFQDGTTDTFPNYLLFHPVDHIRHTRTRDKLQRGVNITWVEFLLTGCTVPTISSQGVPNFDCSEANGKGFLQNADPSLWRDEPQGNSTMRVTYWRNTAANNRTGQPGKGKITFVYQKRAAVVVDPVTVTHSWVDTPAGLELKTTVIIGMLDIGLVAPLGYGGKTASQLAIEGYINGEDRQQAITRNILHFIQEYGNLENVIPMVLEARDGSVVKARPAEAAEAPLPRLDLSTTIAAVSDRG
jgi:hypothetical protein